MSLYGFDHRETLVFNNADFEQFTNFPVLVIVDDSAGKYAGLTASDEINFRDKNENQLSWECAEFNDGGKSYYFVKVPKIEATNGDYIYLYWGTNTSVEDKTGVWDSNYKAVYHMKDETTSTILDSTSNNNDGTKKGANEPIEADSGILGKYQDFDGINDFIDIADSPELVEALTGFTIEVLFNHTGVQGGYEDFGYILNRNDAQWEGTAVYVICAVDTDVIFKATGTVLSAGGIYNDGEDHLFQIKWDGSNIRGYIDGSSRGPSAKENVVNKASTISIGGTRYNDTYRPYNGDVKELRISHIAKSNNYMLAQDKILRQQDYVSFGGSGGILQWFFTESWLKHDKIWTPKLAIPKLSEGYSI